MNSRAQLRDATVSVKGKTDDGKNYELTGDVELVELIVEREEEEFGSWGSLYLPPKFIVSETYWLKFKRKEDGTMYRVQMETTEVERSARVVIDANTLKHINAAQVLCGAPEDSEVRVEELGPKGDLYAQFYWREKVVK